MVQSAAVTMISTRYCGPAKRASTVARAGVLPWETHVSQTLFISSKVRMSESQILAFSSFALLVPACFRSLSIWARIWRVYFPTEGTGLPATWPAR